MDLFRTIVDLFLHLDKHLSQVISHYGVWTNVVLFLIVFAETGLVVTPFLPGDSLLFAVGAVGARPEIGLSLQSARGRLVAAAVLGDAVNYWVGYRFGPAIFSKDTGRLLNREHLAR